MDFTLSENHRLIRDTVRDFATREIRPHARRWDVEERFPASFVPRANEVGLWGLRVPEKYGGSGLDMLGAAIAVEEVARQDGAMGLTVASHNGLCTGHILLAGNEEQKLRWLPKLASGEWLGAWALTEPGSGSDAAGARTTAAKKGDRWVLNGTKTFITQGSIGRICVVLASTTPARKQRGITAFAVEHGTPGFLVGRHLEKLGMRASDTTELTFEDCEIPDENRLGEVDHGFLDTLQILDRGRISIAALALGIGRGAVEEARAYALERKQFGKAIGEFQAIQFMLASSFAEMEAARLLTWRAAVWSDLGRRHTAQSSMAKLWASEAATRACMRAIQIHGGYGYTREFPVERYLRDAKLCEIGEGTSEIQRLVISREALQGG